MTTKVLSLTVNNPTADMTTNKRRRGPTNGRCGHDRRAAGSGREKPIAGCRSVQSVRKRFPCQTCNVVAIEGLAEAKSAGAPGLHELQVYLHCSWPGAATRPPMCLSAAQPWLADAFSSCPSFKLTYRSQAQAVVLRQLDGNSTRRRTSTSMVAWSQTSQAWIGQFRWSTSTRGGRRHDPGHGRGAVLRTLA